MPPLLPDLPGVTHAHHELRTGVRVHVAQAGPADAPPVLCIHGWPQHWWMWRHVIPALEGRFRLVCPDLRGFGWSDQPRDGDFRKQRLADDAVALLDALGIERAHVLGHDWGAWTAMLLGLGAPERVRSLVAVSIVHPWQPRPTAARNAWRFLYQVPLSTPWAGEWLIRRRSFITRLIRSGWGIREAWDAEAATLFEEILREPERARASHLLYRTFLFGELPASLTAPPPATRFAMPARLLIGSRDPLGSQLAAGFERHGDDAAWEIVPGAGHFLPEERPEIVAERAIELFEGA
jgi:pimeloyl-ACP methyl ester carboxylesterase